MNILQQEKDKDRAALLKLKEFRAKLQHRTVVHNISEKLARLKRATTAEVIKPEDGEIQSRLYPPTA
jgi:hypothetical protein